MISSVELITAEALGKSFGTNTVLKDINLAVGTGEVVCVIGPSGSGKTTLLRCMALLEPVTHGLVRMSGQIVSAPDEDRSVRRAGRLIRAEIGMVFQQFNLWPHMTALQNVAEAPMRVRRLPKPDAYELAASLLEKVGMSARRDAYPARLSGGQQQRVAIARALAMVPRVLLFDEPTSALDPELRHEVLQVMRNLAADGMTMMVVTHEMGFARRMANRVVFMDEGELVEQGAPAAFFGTPQTERAKRFLAKLED
jgi:polar amino acid transport system ATP-binding protein